MRSRANSTFNNLGNSEEEMTVPIRYLVINKDGGSFYTNWFSEENNYVEGMIVVDLLNDVITKNGKDWLLIDEDSL